MLVYLELPLEIGLAKISDIVTLIFCINFTFKKNLPLAVHVCLDL